MIETLISSKTRIKLLLKFFLNSETTSYLRSLETEFGDSTNSIRVELNRLEHAGMLSSAMDGNKKLFKANTKHPLFNEIHNIVIKHLGFDTIIEKVINQLGHIELVYITGPLSKGQDSQEIELILIGDINEEYLLDLIQRVEKLIKRKVKYQIWNSVLWSEKNLMDFDSKPFLIWEHE
jgi:hypothetical protein